MTRIALEATVEARRFGPQQWISQKRASLLEEGL